MDGDDEWSAAKVRNVVMRTVQEIGIRCQARDLPVFLEAIDGRSSLPEFELRCRQTGYFLLSGDKNPELKLVVDAGDVLKQIPQVSSDAGRMDHPRVDADRTLHA